MNDYPVPGWLRARGITNAEYARWLDDRAGSAWRRETRSGRAGFRSREALKREMHRAAHASDGFDPYSGSKMYVRHMRTGWIDGQAALNGSREHLTMRRCLPTFDHVRGLGKRQLELCTRETNSAKSFMSPRQFVELCLRVAGRHPHGYAPPGLAEAAPAGDHATPPG